LIASASSPSLSITFQGTAPRLLSGDAAGDAAGEAAPEEAILAVVRHQAGDRPITLISGRAADPRELRDRPIIAAQIGDGWLVFRGPPRTRFRGPFGIYSFPVSALLLIGIPLVTLSLWAARRLISPLARLAQASETLSLEGALLPIPANAPVEIRRLAGSFNALVGRLQKFAADRTGMLAAISHDLRTPLTRLRLRTEQLDDDLLRAKMLRDIRAMEEMITSTLAYVDQQRVPGPAEQLDLAALLQTLCDEFADAGFDVTYAGPLHCPAAGRPGALERALNNLIENAIKFGDAAALTLDDSGACLVIDVCDDGPGVPDEEKEHVLKPFYRVDTARNDAKGGIGLGLAIASAIAQSHGGQLELRDREPHGLCVRMTLPRPARTARIGLAA
jgi:signal transduction histidine kinase